MEKLTPEEAITMWRELEDTGAVPYAASEDLILAMTESTGHGEKILPPKLTEFGTDMATALMFTDYLRRGNVVKAFREIADKLGRITNTTPVNQDVWQEYGSTYRRHLFTLFDQRQYQFGRRTGNLMLAPVQATVGLITVAAIRGIMTPDGSVEINDVIYMAKGTDRMRPFTLLSGDCDYVAQTVSNILIDQGVVKVPEIVTQPETVETTVSETAETVEMPAVSLPVPETSDE